MATPLLTTKFFIPPPRANLVPRPGLFQRLDQGLHASLRLTLICASAGYGKTSLVSAWLQHLEAKPSGVEPAVRATAWLSLDKRDIIDKCQRRSG